MGPPIPYGLTRASWRRGMRDLDDAGRLLALPNPPVNFILLLYAELISMYTIHLPRRARKHYLAGDPPFLNDFSRDEVHQLFGFRTHAQLRRVMIALGVPAIIRTRERYWLYTNHSLPRLSNMAWVKARMPLYAQCIVAKLKSIYPQDKWNLIPIDIWSFIDGTIRPCAKPSSRSFPGLNLQVDFVRIAVEWGFKDINCTWRWLNDKHRNKLGETPLRKHYMNATFLSNLIVCVTGGTQTSAFFECEPPTLEEYLLMTNP
ncbi:hypothetical protein NFJ02_37g93100 [Pycnococcus provasolii]